MRLDRDTKFKLLWARRGRCFHIFGDDGVNRANYHEQRQALDRWAAHVMALVTKPKAKAGARPGATPVKMAA